MHEFLQVEGQGGAGYGQRLADFACHAAVRTGFDQQSEDCKPGGVAQRRQRGDYLIRFHFSRIIE